MIGEQKIRYQIYEETIEALSDRNTELTENIKRNDHEIKLRLLQLEDCQRHNFHNRPKQNNRLW